MHQDFGLNMVPSSFTGSVGSISVVGPSVWIGEMSITGVVPLGETITVGARPYAF